MEDNQTALGSVVKYHQTFYLINFQCDRNYISLLVIVEIHPTTVDCLPSDKTVRKDACMRIIKAKKNKNRDSVHLLRHPYRESSPFDRAAGRTTQSGIVKTYD